MSLRLVLLFTAEGGVDLVWGVHEAATRRPRGSVGIFLVLPLDKKSLVQFPRCLLKPAAGSKQEEW